MQSEYWYTVAIQNTHFKTHAFGVNICASQIAVFSTALIGRSFDFLYTCYAAGTDKPGINCPTGNI
jgi:hypothetical protein